MSWSVYFHPKFGAEFEELGEAVQDQLLAILVPLRERGPMLGRPEVDTLNDSKFSNMKELRFKADGGVWRVAFAFDPAVTPLFWSRATSPAAVRRSFIGG